MHAQLYLDKYSFLVLPIRKWKFYKNNLKFITTDNKIVI